MNNLESKAFELLGRLEKLTENYAPEAIDLALQAVYVTSLGNLVIYVIGIIIPIGFMYLFHILANKFDFIDRDLKIIGWGVIGTISFFCVMASILNLFSIWNWVGLFNPELFMAHKLLGI